MKRKTLTLKKLRDFWNSIESSSNSPEYFLIYTDGGTKRMTYKQWKKFIKKQNDSTPIRPVKTKDGSKTPSLKKSSLDSRHS